MEKTKNKIISAQKLQTNIYLDEFKVDKRIIPLFKTPIILKKIQLLKTLNTDETIKIHAAAQKLSFKIKPLNIKLVKYSNDIFNYKLNINKLILNNIKIKNINNSKFLFLENNDLSSFKFYLKKLLWP